MIKEPDDISPYKTYVAPHTVELLRSALLHVLSESKEGAGGRSAKDSFENIVNVPQIPLQIVIGGLIDRLRQPDEFYLDGYFTTADSRPTLIAKFIGILELLKSHIILLDEDGSSIPDNGITDMMSHVRITLIASEEDIRASSLEWE